MESEQLIVPLQSDGEEIVVHEISSFGQSGHSQDDKPLTNEDLLE